MGKRNQKGQFVKTTGSARYKKVQYRGTIMHESHRVMCIALAIDRLPKGLMVHHVDGDTHNDSLDNLALMNYKAHNIIHVSGREPWNKGLTTETNLKWSRAIKKRMKASKMRHDKNLEETWELYCHCLDANEIAEELNLCVRQVYSRIKDIVK